MAGSRIAVLLDLDDTLVVTAPIEPLRRQRNWAAVARAFGQTSLPAGTGAFLDAVAPDVVGVVTSSPRSYAEGILRHHRLSVPVLVAYHDTARHKPCADPLLEAARRAGIEPGRCIHVGDAPADAEASAAAGMAHIAVSWLERASPACHAWDEVLARIDRQRREWAGQPNSGSEGAP